jgi:hypothetical protein
MPGELSEIQKGLLLTLQIGAALADATNPERLRLREEVNPLVQGDYRQTGDIKPVYDKIQEIMGEEWKPSGKWKSYQDSVSEVPPLEFDSE